MEATGHVNFEYFLGSMWQYNGGPSDPFVPWPAPLAEPVSGKGNRAKRRIPSFFGSRRFAISDRSATLPEFSHDRSVVVANLIYVRQPPRLHVACVATGAIRSGCAAPRIR
jgi:hypothetical protein